MNKCKDNIHSYEKIANDTYLIDEGGFVNMYLLIGEDKALLIDSGLGLGNIKESIREITDKEVILSLTHNHCDHSHGKGYFDSYYLPKDDDCLSLRLLSTRLACHLVTRGHKVKYHSLPYRHPKKILLEEGHVFNLGNREIKAEEYPGHTKGSVVYLDEKEHIMITGDDVNPCLFLRLPGGVCLSKWLVSARKILLLSKTYKPFYGHMDGKQDYEQIKKTITLGEEMLHKTKKGFKKRLVIYPSLKTFPHIIINKDNIK